MKFLADPLGYQGIYLFLPVDPPSQTRVRRLSFPPRFTRHGMEMIDRTVSLAEGGARSDTGFDVADGWFDG